MQPIGFSPVQPRFQQQRQAGSNSSYLASPVPFGNGGQSGNGAANALGQLRRALLGPSGQDGFIRQDSSPRRLSKGRKSQHPKFNSPEFNPNEPPPAIGDTSGQWVSPGPVDKNRPLTRQITLPDRTLQAEAGSAGPPHARTRTALPTVSLPLPGPGENASPSLVRHEVLAGNKRRLRLQPLSLDDDLITAIQAEPNSQANRDTVGKAAKAYYEAGGDEQTLKRYFANVARTVHQAAKDKGLDKPGNVTRAYTKRNPLTQERYANRNRIKRTQAGLPVHQRRNYTEIPGVTTTGKPLSSKVPASRSKPVNGQEAGEPSVQA